MKSNSSQEVSFSMMNHVIISYENDALGNLMETLFLHESIKLFFKVVSLTLKTHALQALIK